MSTEVNSLVGSNEPYGRNTIKGTNAEMLALTPTNVGVEFYNTDNKAYYYWDGTQWVSGIGALTLYKSGTIPGGSFIDGPIRKYNVVFATAFPDANYSVSVVGEDNRTWSIENKTQAGFTISANSGSSVDGDTDWTAIKHNDL